MKREEFKNLIKESVKEVLIEDGVLSTIISEVLKGTQMSQNVVKEEVVRPAITDTKKKMLNEQKRIGKDKILETKRKMLDAIGKDSYNGIDLFEGTAPMRGAPEPGSAPIPQSPLSDIDPDDSGVDISHLMSRANIWKKLAK